MTPVERRHIRKTIGERLTFTQLGELRTDVRFTNPEDSSPQGITLFAVDAYDVIQFCFPVPPTANWDYADTIEEQADYYSAMTFAINNVHFGPLLLPEYLAELVAFAGTFESRFGQRQAAERLLLSRVRQELTASLSPIPTLGDRDTQVDYLGEHFSLLFLSAATSALRIGFQELARIAKERTTTLSSLVRKLPPRAASSIAYTPNVAFIAACEDILGYENSQQDLPSVPGRRARANDHADAVALDRVIQLNHALALAYRGGLLRQPTRVLILSSSARLQRLVNGLKGRATSYSPAHSPAGFGVLRVPDQLFAYVIAKPFTEESTSASGLGGVSIGGARRDEVLQTLQWLLEIETASSGLRRRAHSCGTCALDGHANRTCPNRTTCDRLAVLERHWKGAIQPYINSNKNLSLFRQLRPFLLGDFPAGTDETEVAILALLRSILSNEESVEASQLKLVLERTALRSEVLLAHVTCVGIRRDEYGDVFEYPTRDRIRGAYQALPWLLRVKSPRHRLALHMIRDAFFKSPSAASERHRRLQDAVMLLLDSDPTEREGDDEVESDLVRAIALLSLSDPDSEDTAVSLAKLAFRRASMDQRADVLYVYSWALRRVGNAVEAKQWAQRGIALAPNDPRLLHSKALAALSIFKADPSQPAALAEIRILFEQASASYENWPKFDDFSREAKEDLAAACLNTLAYTHILGLPTPVLVKSARGYLRALKSRFPRKQWAPGFPEFFHTEANIELIEARLANDPADRRKSLKNAARAIDEALKLVHGRADYVELQEEILDSLKVDESNTTGNA